MGEKQETSESNWGQEEWVKEILAALARTSAFIWERWDSAGQPEGLGWPELQVQSLVSLSDFPSFKPPLDNVQPFHPESVTTLTSLVLLKNHFSPAEQVFCIPREEWPFPLPLQILPTSPSFSFCFSKNPLPHPGANFSQFRLLVVLIIFMIHLNGYTAIHCFLNRVCRYQIKAL